MSTRGARRPRLRLWRAALLVLAGVLILSVASAQAATAGTLPARGDVTAARALVATQTRYYAAALARRRDALSNVGGFIAHITNQCPQALPDTLLDGGPTKRTVFKQLFTEGALDLALAAYQPLGHATAVEIQALDRIHFSKRSVTRAVHQLARSQRATLTLAPTDLCGDIQSAAAGGFDQVPAQTTQFVTRVENVLAGPAPSFNELIDDIRPDIVTRRDTAAVTHLRALGIRYTDFALDLGTNAGSKLAHALGADQ